MCLIVWAGCSNIRGAHNLGSRGREERECYSAIQRTTNPFLLLLFRLSPLDEFMFRLYALSELF